jgi:hypothetical protein
MRPDDRRLRVPPEQGFHLVEENGSAPAFANGMSMSL